MTCSSPLSLPPSVRICPPPPPTPPSPLSSPSFYPLCLPRSPPPPPPLLSVSSPLSGSLPLFVCTPPPPPPPSVSLHLPPVCLDQTDHTVAENWRCFLRVQCGVHLPFVLRTLLSEVARAFLATPVQFSVVLRPRRPNRPLGAGAQDVHLDFPTAPKL